ncbi:hypothetical protein ABVK25_000826 [Lepraria finkii]|uniref:HD domain-containing protein n=1 Tax=Lepraria finkii TaxID=1340010 RepID=A0ABR4BP06_9LECA
MMLAPSSLSSKLNIPLCTKMALVHDMAEALVGDITPIDGVTKDEKSRREAETMEYLSRELLGVWGGGEQGLRIREVWEEYEEGKTRESVFVHDVDKIELLVQMVEYERRGQEGGKLDLGEFAHVARKIHGVEVREWAREVLREREEFWKGRGREATMLGVMNEL